MTGPNLLTAEQTPVDLLENQAEIAEIEEQLEDQVYLVARGYIEFGKNGFARNELNYEDVQRAWWDVIAANPDGIDSEMKTRVQELFKDLREDESTQGEARLQSPPSHKKPEQITATAGVHKLAKAIASELIDVVGEDARCLDADPEAFFPEKGGSTRESKRICAQCPVQQDCLDFALRNDEQFGVWGGLSERERKRLKRLSA